MNRAAILVSTGPHHCTPHHGTPRVGNLGFLAIMPDVG
jgi:hypothetical protein